MKIVKDQKKKKKQKSRKIWKAYLSSESEVEDRGKKRGWRGKLIISYNFQN